VTLPRRRAAGLIGALVAVGMAAVGCGGGDDDGGEAYREPKGPASETIEVGAGNFFFDPDDVEAASGITELEMIGTNGSHTFVFDDGAYVGFQLEVDGDGTDAKKIDLEPGEYVFYCDVIGHRQQGMEGTLTVR
jgi:plastocyanin